MGLTPQILIDLSSPDDAIIFPSGLKANTHNVSRIKLQFECFLTICRIADSDSVIVDNTGVCQ